MAFGRSVSRVSLISGVPARKGRRQRLSAIPTLGGRVLRGLFPLPLPTAGSAKGDTGSIGRPIRRIPCPGLLFSQVPDRARATSWSAMTAAGTDADGHKGSVVGKRSSIAGGHAIGCLSKLVGNNGGSARFRTSLYAKLYYGCMTTRSSCWPWRVPRTGCTLSLSDSPQTRSC